MLARNPKKRALFQVNKYTLSVRSPWKSAISTFVAFVICGMVPLLPFMFSLKSDFLISAILAGVTFFFVGALKSKWSLESFYLSGVKTLFIGSVSSTIAYLTGSLLEGRF